MIRYLLLLYFSYQISKVKEKRKKERKRNVKCACYTDAAFVIRNGGDMNEKNAVDLQN